ncbi:Phospholipase A I [Penicillium rolfsii]|nr:Phospholipase A I [Penicillium rolfsii]
MSPQPSLNKVKDLPVLPCGNVDDSPSPSNGDYIFQADPNKDDSKPLVSGKSDAIENRIWFKTNALNAATIKSFQSIQLFAETHDQGHVDDTSLGNWTWLELAIFEDESSDKPRTKDSVELVWLSHKNRFLTDEYGWMAGQVFGRDHDLLRQLEPGNVLAVRVCARFPGWELYGKDAYLIFDVGDETDLDPPPAYSSVLQQMMSVQQTLDEVNDLKLKASDQKIDKQSAAFKPQIPLDLTRADAFAGRDERPLRVLSLDGGGVRGIASLLILQAVLDKAAPGKKPCEIFDMIGGTSTGGLIAIMLSRLQMTVAECIAQYDNVMKEVFPETGDIKKAFNLATHGEFYDSSNLENIIKKLIKDKLGDSDVDLLDETGPCKFFLMATNSQAANNRAPVFLRSYKNPNNMENSALVNMKLWQAARATSAAPAYFKPLQVDGYTLVDGGLGANNPLGWLWTEVLGVFGPTRATDCFLSIGTGIAANAPVIQPGIIPSHAVEESYISVATNSELMNIMFRTLLDAFAPVVREHKYWRMNVYKDVLTENKVVEGGWLNWKNEVVSATNNYESPGDLDDVKAALGKLTDWTKEYIVQEQTMIADCAAAIARNIGK